jgi:hypothetical protein
MLEEDTLWANSTKQEIESIAKNWSKKYTLRQLQSLRQDFLNHLKNLPELTITELQGKNTDNSIQHQSINNRLIVLSRAIDIIEFGNK